MNEQPDPIDELGSELRQRVGREFRWEAEDVEADSELGRLRRRAMTDVVVELMHRGDTVVVGSADVILTGKIVHARTDLAIVETGHAVASVNLAGPIYVKVADRARAGGIPTFHGGSGSFKARLAEFEQTGEIVRVIATGLAESIEGRIAVAGTDHVVVTGRDRVEWYVPASTIAMVLQPITRQ